MTRHLPPRPQLDQCGIEHPQGERLDQTCLLRKWNELIRWNEAAPRVLPADQGLHAFNGPGRAPHLGLIVEHQLVTVDGAPQLTE